MTRPPQPRRPVELARMRAVDELRDLAAARAELDEPARCALHALAQLGDPRAPQLLLTWLGSPAGADHARMLLTSLADCGDAAAADALEQQLAFAGSREAFFHHAIDSIRARHRAHQHPSATTPDVEDA